MVSEMKKSDDDIIILDDEEEVQKILQIKREPSSSNNPQGNKRRNERRSKVFKPRWLATDMDGSNYATSLYMGSSKNSKNAARKPPKNGPKQ